MIFSDGKGKKEKLEQVGSYRLYGNVMSLQIAPLSGTGRDALLMSFQEAKVCLSGLDFLYQFVRWLVGRGRGQKIGEMNEMFICHYLTMGKDCNGI